MSPAHALSESDQPLLDVFAKRGWTAAPFQREVWQRFLRGESGLLHAPSGSGKTLAAFGGPLLQALQCRSDRSIRLRVLWITPMRAVATDAVKTLRDTIEELGIAWEVAPCIGDDASRDRPPATEGCAEIVATTPESLARMLSYPESRDIFSELTAVIVDEWHDLIDTKRGVLLQLCLARLRKLAPPHPLWGLTATIGNLEEARDVLLPMRRDSAIVSGAAPRTLMLETLVPAAPTRFPWAGHLGVSQLKPVLERLLKAKTSIVFTNTRSQAKLWHRALASEWPDAPETLALHHDYLSEELCAKAEQGLREGTVRSVVAMSSFDLGEDFPAVDLVMQIGSPKTILRLLQRSSRIKHRPGEPMHIVCVPTHALELAEFAAAREAIARGEIEPRRPLTLCLDVLAQHCVTIALGGGFIADDLLAEVRSTHAFAELVDRMWQRTLDLIVQGVATQSNDPEFKRVIRDDDGMYRVGDRTIATRHRLTIDTLANDSVIDVRSLKGKHLGVIEEEFVSRLRPGDRFHFAGRPVALERLKNMSAYVRAAPTGAGAVPRWRGGRMSLSSELGAEVERLISLSRRTGPEMLHLRSLLDTQCVMSALPTRRELLVEWTQYDEKWFLTIYPFAGHAVNEGIAALVASRWSREITTTFAYAANDYGFIIALPRQTLMDEVLLRGLLATENLIDDVRACFNVGELSRRQFREIARIAGLLPPSQGGKSRSMRHLQASTGLIYDMLQRSDPNHPLLVQAQREVFETQLDVREITEVLERCAKRDIRLTYPIYLTPFTFPLWAERYRDEWSNEEWRIRVARASEHMDIAN